MNIYEAIKTNSSRFQVLKKLDKLFEELSEIDYGDREDSPRYGNMEPGLNEQSTISEEIKNLVQDNNITKEEFTEVFEPYKYGIDISFEDYEYQPKHAKKEDLTEGAKYHYITNANDPASIGAEYEYNSMANTDVIDILQELKMYFNQAEKDAKEIIANATHDPGVYESDIEMCKFCAEKVQEMIDKMNSTWE